MNQRWQSVPGLAVARPARGTIGVMDDAARWHDLDGRERVAELSEAITSLRELSPEELVE